MILWLTQTPQTVIICFVYCQAVINSKFRLVKIQIITVIYSPVQGKHDQTFQVKSICIKESSKFPLCLDTVVKMFLFVIILDWQTLRQKHKSLPKRGLELGNNGTVGKCESMLAL